MIERTGGIGMVEAQWFDSDGTQIRIEAIYIILMDTHYYWIGLNQWTLIWRNSLL